MAVNYLPATLDLAFVQGDDFSVVLDISGDRSAYTFTAKYRMGMATAASFTVAVGAYASSVTPVTLSLTDTVTDALETGEYLWDLQWVDGSALVRTVVSGALTVVGDVT